MAGVGTVTTTRTRISTTSAVSKTGLPPAQPAGVVETPAGGTGDRGKGAAEGVVAVANAGKSTRKR